MIRIPPALEAAGLNAAMLLQVHDELIFEVPKAEVEATRNLVARVMESAARLDVPLVVDTGVGDNWEGGPLGHGLMKGWRKFGVRFRAIQFRWTPETGRNRDRCWTSGFDPTRSFEARI